MEQFQSDQTENDYISLLEDAYSALLKIKPEKTEKKIIPHPKIARQGKLGVCIINFQQICKEINRPLVHVYDYFLSELCSKGSIDSKNRFLIRGVFNQSKIESLTTKYIKEYVSCKICKSMNTNLKRDSTLRLDYVDCQDCMSENYVSSIKLN